MDKEEAMKILKDFHDKSALFSVRTALETLHPELVESEDEKTRKRIIALVNAHGQGMYKDDMLAWLEKQGEQKPVDKVETRFGTNVAKEIFNDLYESDDENVRKWLLNLVQSLPDKGLIFSSYDDIEKAKVLDWLKSLKQKIGG